MVKLQYSISSKWTAVVITVVSIILFIKYKMINPDVCLNGLGCCRSNPYHFDFMIPGTI